MVRMIEKEVGCVAILRMRIMAESNEHGHSLYIFARCVFECLIVPRKTEKRKNLLSH